MIKNHFAARISGLILSIAICFQIGAQTIDLERAYALFYSKDYATCIQEVECLMNSPESYKVENMEDILYCGVLCCQELMTQLNHEISMMSVSDMNVAKLQEVWDIEVDFMMSLERKCDYHLEMNDDFESRQHYLSLKIGIYSILVSETDIAEYEKELKSLNKQYKKEIFPKLQRSSMSSADILNGYSVVMTSLALEGDLEGMLDCMLNTIEPWFCSSVLLNYNLENIEKTIAFTSYKGLINLMNNGLEDDYSPSDKYISALMGLNIRVKNMSYYLKGNKMYKSHIQDQWQQIQKSLKDGEIAIDFCNVKQYEHVFAFIIDNKCKYPRLEYCGHRHRVGGDFFGFYHLLQREGIKEIRHIFYSTTEEMAFIDMGENERAHKLHSISELLMPKIKSEASPTIYSFADINYWLGDSTIYDNENDVKGAITTEKLKGAKRELDFLRTSIPSYQLHFFSHDIATKEAFISITNQTFDILHVSSHGFFDKENSRKASNDDLRSSIEGITILDNCGIKLSGYNDDTESGCISATEISKLNLSNVGLVVLSACETGTGDSREGNIYSLAEAFHTAGVRNIIATTTQVEDNDAYTFFKTFMTEVTNGNSYHDSFVIAQKKSKKPGNYVFWE